MIIKKYQAKTESEAMQLAKLELGANVVLMNVRQIKKKGIFKFFSAPTVEITVALEEDNEKQRPISAVKSISTPTALGRLHRNTNPRMAAERIMMINHQISIQLVMR